MKHDKEWLRKVCAQPNYGVAGETVTIPKGFTVIHDRGAVARELAAMGHSKRSTRPRKAPSVDSSGPITVELPYPPSANAYWRFVTIKGVPRVLVSQQARDYKKMVASRASLFYQRGPLSGALRLTAHFYRAAKRGDLDNGLKILCDSLKGTLFADDKQIEEIHAFRHEDKDNPRVRLELSKI